MPGVIVIGAGPGIGLSVARRFALEGLPVGLIARSRATVDAALAALADAGVETHGATADAADEGSLRAALDELVDRFGVPDALVYNAAIIQWDSVGEQVRRGSPRRLGGERRRRHHRRGAPAPQDGRAQRGHLRLTGGMPDPVPEVTSLSLGKAGVRALAELLDKRFGPSGVHVATVTVGGAVAPGTAFDPDDIAEHYWRLHIQRPHAWEREVLLDGRPASVRHGVRER